MAYKDITEQVIKKRTDWLWTSWQKGCEKRHENWMRNLPEKLKRMREINTQLEEENAMSDSLNHDK